MVCKLLAAAALNIILVLDTNDLYASAMVEILGRDEATGPRRHPIPRQPSPSSGQFQNQRVDRCKGALLVCCGSVCAPSRRHSNA